MKLESGMYFGETLSSLKFSGLVLTEKTHQAGEVLPEHFHENAYFCLALEGGWQETAEGKVFESKVNHVIYHPKEESHRTSFSKGQQSKTFNVEITRSWLEKMASFNMEPLQNRILNKDNSLAGYIGKIYKEFYRRDHLSSLAIESHFIELYIHLSRNSDNTLSKERKKLQLEDVQGVLTSTYLDPLSLPELAKKFGVHPVYLSKSFKKMSGLTISEYYRNCRIKDACRLLRDTKTPLVQIALDCGFYDQSHFCKYFQLIVGMSPLAYRKNPHV